MSCRFFLGTCACKNCTRVRTRTQTSLISRFHNVQCRVVFLSECIIFPPILTIHEPITLQTQNTCICMVSIKLMSGLQFTTIYVCTDFGKGINLDGCFPSFVTIAIVMSKNVILVLRTPNGYRFIIYHYCCLSPSREQA